MNTVIRMCFIITFCMHFLRMFLSAFSLIIGVNNFPLSSPDIYITYAVLSRFERLLTFI